MPQDSSAEKMTQAEIIAWGDTWSPVAQAIFASPEGPHICPFCGQPSVHAAWGLYNENPRLASFDAWCESCKKRYHCATELPAHAPDSFPPRTTHVVADLTKRVFERGKKLKWW